MKKAILIYYSYSGNTKYIASKVAASLGLDSFEITPLKEYTKDVNGLINQMRNNQKDKPCTDIKWCPVNFDNYDVVIIGTPVWWYTIPPVTRTFLKEYDLTGKLIIPLITSGSEPGESLEEIKKLCVGSPVKGEGLFQFDMKKGMISKEEDIEGWIESVKEILAE
ncbi:MAG: NAD(P)H-dependent oxidoreductase [Coprobacillus sp.]|nr:NAD(P)H-dependent oxidoreductase [Coprobacillus sp.]